MRRNFWPAVLLLAMGLLAGCAASAHASLTSLAAPLRQARVHVVPFRPALGLIKPRVNAASAPAASTPASLAREKIKHVILIMQENRSFDSYFGTYPGADGIPMQNGVPAACVPDPKTNACVRPYHDPQDINAGGPHAAAAAGR